VLVPLLLRGIGVGVSSVVNLQGAVRQNVVVDFVTQLGGKAE
jgi:hypothetical protein